MTTHNVEANLQLFFDDIHTEVTNTAGNLRRINSKDQSVFNDVKEYASEVIDLTHRICKKAIIHYPVTTLTVMIVATVVHAICALFFISFTALIALGFDIAYAMKFGKLMERALQIYDTFNIFDEWTSDPDAKRAIIAAISPKETVITLAHRAKNFVRDLFSF